jgi:hypothetical protein
MKDNLVFMKTSQVSEKDEIGKLISNGKVDDIRDDYIGNE